MFTNYKLVIFKVIFISNHAKKKTTFAQLLKSQTIHIK